jgi:hypothetical protein
MFDAFGVPRAWAGETAQRKHDARPKWSGRPAGANGGATEKIVEIRQRLAAELSSKFQAAAQANHGPEAGGDMASRPVTNSEQGPETISNMVSGPGAHRFRSVPDSAIEPAVPRRNES